MDEPRDQPPEQGTRAPIVVVGTRLAPPQEAWQAFVRHVTVTCPDCRDIDQPRCEGAEQLWRAYRAIGDAAYRRLRGGTA